MAKKGESDEKVQADGGPEARGETVSGEPGEREAAALVAGGDRCAAEGEGAQPEAPAPGAAGDGAGVVSDADEQPAPVVPAGDPPAGEPDAQAADQAAAGTAPAGEGHVESGGDLAAGAPAAVTDVVLGAAGGGMAEALDDGPIDFGDMALQAAIEAYEAALLAGAVIGAVTAGTDALDPDMTDGAYDEIGAFVRKIGRRATPDVIGQQLKILGHRASPDLSEPERIAFGAFAHVLVELDAFAAAEAERAKRATEAPAEIPPLPIEDTTMETVDNALDTWG